MLVVSSYAPWADICPYRNCRAVMDERLEDAVTRSLSLRVVRDFFNLREVGRLLKLLSVNRRNGCQLVFAVA
jgi:hypothetical protein